MKILYIAPQINNEGGVARVLSIKSNYLIQKRKHQVHILTQNNGNFPLFFDFDSSIEMHDMSLLGNPVKFLFSYKQALNELFSKINPDVVFVLDNGLKAFLLPYLLKTKIPVILEIHGSKYVQEKEGVNKLFNSFSIKIKEVGIKRFTKVVFLSNDSALEWNYKNPIIISNPISFSTNEFSKLSSKKVIAVARHSYEKGLDRMLKIWRKVILKYPDWSLEIYGKSNKNQSLQKMANSLNISNNVVFFEPIKNISEKYIDSSLCIMSSRSEGFPMVLLEAMSCGLPCIAYDCPCGPRAIINNNENGFLIEDGNLDSFVEKIELLINDNELRMQMGDNARKTIDKYNLEIIMQQWELLCKTVV